MAIVTLGRLNFKSGLWKLGKLWVKRCRSFHELSLWYSFVDLVEGLPRRTETCRGPFDHLLIF